MCVLCTRMDLIQVCLDAEDVVLPEEPILLDTPTKDVGPLSCCSHDKSRDTKAK